MIASRYNYGPEAPVKRRRKADAPTAPLVYPDLPEELTYRVHFLERGSLKRERSAALTGALLDRLTHHVHILEMNGQSFRLNHSRARNKGSTT